MDADDFVTVSARREVIPDPEADPEATLRHFLGAYARALRDAGCSIIGHIKGMLEDGVSPPLFFSLTSLAGEASLKGGPVDGKGGLVMSITAIVAGIDRDEASRILERSLSGYFKPVR